MHHTIRQFRENLAGYLKSGRPLAITRHGETLRFFLSARKRSLKAEVEGMRAAAKELDAMISAWGTSEDELMEEYKEVRRKSRAEAEHEVVGMELLEALHQHRQIPRAVAMG